MKRLILTLFVICAIGLSAQNLNKKHSIIRPSEFKNTESINPVAIGKSANAWGFYFNRTTYLWANDDINSISFIHRMENDPGSSYLAYDVSKDGGQTWSLNNQVYDPTDQSNARYPQGLLYNPAGNTNPDEAYFSYFTPTMDGSNGSWGGYSWGSKKLAEGALPTQNNLASTGSFLQYIPSGLTVTQLGESWVVDQERIEAGDYTGNLIIGHGIWNNDTEDFDYTFEHKPLVINADARIQDVKIAFAPDGMTGWICAITNLEYTLDLTWYHPIFFKTTDGGENWTEEPIEVQLGGNDGIESIMDFISDEDLAEHFIDGVVPDRDEIPYFMGFHMDLAVDAWGNPHVLGVVGLCNEEINDWYSEEGLFAMFHLYSNDQGESWDAFNIDYLQTFNKQHVSPSSGSEMNMYNRPQVATTPDGAIVFFSFLDTKIEGSTENDQPDIYFREYFPGTDTHGDELICVTEWSFAMWEAYWGCMSHYVFADVTGDSYECTIPFVYEELLENDDVNLPVQFWYIPDFERSYTVVSIDEINNPLVSLAQNFPNPIDDITYFNINLLKESDVRIDIYNTSGQLVKKYNFNQLSNGPHQLTLDFSNINAGAYFYNLKAGESSYKGKMIVQ